MKNKILKAVLISALIITLTIADFIILGVQFVTYAQEDTENVKFEVYFKKESEKLSSMDYQMNYQDMKLYMKVVVEDGIRFDGQITLSDSNFKIKNQLNNGIAAINDNTITLNPIIGGNSIEIEVGIEPIIAESYDISMLSKESKLTLSGSYISNANQNININISKNITLNLVIPQNIEDLTKFKSKVITNNVYKIKEADTRIAQIELNWEITDNVYPVKTTTFEITLPEEAKFEEIISKGTYLSNGQADRKIEEYNLENNILTVTVSNVETNGKVSWKQDGKDNIIVTFKLNGEEEVSKENYNIKSKIEFYGEENKKIEKQTSYNLAETVDGMITLSIDNKEEIYKGKIYSKEEREFNSKTNIEINYANIIGVSELRERVIYTTENEVKEANVQYKTTTILKSEFERILGIDGTLIIKNQNGELVKELKITDFADEESFLVVYLENVKGIIIEISKPIVTGIIRLKHTKVIKPDEYDINQIREFKNLAEQASVKYNSSTFQTEKLNVLNETKAEVGVTLSNTTLSEESKNITITMTLKNDSEKYELFANPEFKFTFPEGVTINSVSEASISATADSLTLSTVASNKNQIILRIDGVQQQYITSDINPQITFIANVSIEKLMPNKTEAIKLEYVNKYVNKDNIYQVESEQIKVIASNSDVVTNVKVENYDEIGSTIQKHSDNKTQVTGELKTESSQKNAIIKYTVINNYNSQISVIPIVISNYIDNEGKETRLANYAEQNVILNAGEVKEIEIALTIPENLEFSEEIKIQSLLEYIYSGTKYQVKNNIDLKTMDKKGFRESTIVDNKIKVETYAQLGDGSGVKETDLISNEQIVKYIIDVTNISNEPITNINIKNVQQAGNIFDLKEVEVINWVESIEPYMEHIYAELDTNIKEFEIEKIEPGETKELICRVVAKKDKALDNITIANISISADKIQEQNVQALKNSIKDSSIKISTRKALKEEVDIYGDSSLLILSKIRNIKDTTEEDVKIKIFLSEGIYWGKDSIIEAFDENSEELDIVKNIKYDNEENCIEVNLSNLEPNQEITLTTMTFTKEIPIDEAYRDEKIYLEVDDVISNDINIKVKQMESKLEVQQTSNATQGKKFKNGETVILIGEIKNIGVVETVISINDDLPEGLEAKEVTLIKNNEEVYSSTKHNKDFVIVDYELGANENVTIKIEAEVNTSRIVPDSIENVMIVSQELGETVKSNSIIIDIENETNNSSDSEEPVEKPEKPEQGKPSMPAGPGDIKPEDNPGGEKPGDNEPNEEKPKEKYYTIEGIAWVDKNKNNTKDTDELLENVIVKIIDLDNKNTFLKDETGKEIEVKTGKDGSYKIENLPKGNYNIIFKYDTGIYEIEETTKIKNYIIEATKEKVAITNNIELSSNKTIDLKLFETTEFDLKLDKYISKVVVQTVNGTKTTTYTDKKLAREEIQAKYLTGATVLVEYTIKITNVGDMEGYATQIIDYIPNDMKFYSELNTQWYMGEDGNLYNTSLANEKIKQNETKELKLVLSKTMSKENAGVTLNTAEIKDMTNVKQYEDMNSNNNQSKAEIIVNPATGTIITYIIAILSAITIIAVGVYITNKKIVGKELK